MKIAVIGSRNLHLVGLERYLPADTTEIVSGGARGIDQEAAEYARAHGLQVTEFLPDYRRYGRGAPLRRNREIAEYADGAIAFWDGVSRGTAYTIRLFEALGKPVTVVRGCGN